MPLASTLLSTVTLFVIHSSPLSMLCSLSGQEVEELVDSWVPEPLLEPLGEEDEKDLASVPVIVGPTGAHATLQNGQEVTNLASFNFIGLAGN